MIDEDKLTVVDKGNNYTINELKAQHNQFTYLRSQALVCKFDGVDNALDFISENLKQPKREGSSADIGSGGFHTFETYEEALEIFRHKPESVVKYDPSELRIKDESESGSRVDYDVVGDYIDMGRYMEGVPESWGSMHSGHARNRRVNIIINLNQVHYIGEEDINHRSERILRLVDALEGGGVRTMMTCIDSNDCGHTEIILKRHEEPLTIADLAVVTHSEFKRRLIFRINEYSKTWSYGYGKAFVFGEAVRPENIRSDNNEEMTIYIDGSMSDREDIDERFDQLERLLIWEMSKPVPEVDAIKADRYGIYFSSNGYRPDSEVQREGKEAIKDE